MRALLGPFLLAIVLSACGEAPVTGADGGLACRQAFPMDRVASEACCPDWGVDACGAGLFCAAFDGRQQATCYPNGSRRSQEQCTADVQCLSNSCNAQAGQCRSMQYEPCGPAGCAPTNAFGSPLSCKSGSCST